MVSRPKIAANTLNVIRTRSVPKATVGMYLSPPLAGALTRVVATTDVVIGIPRFQSLTREGRRGSHSSNERVNRGSRMSGQGPRGLVRNSPSGGVVVERGQASVLSDEAPNERSKQQKRCSDQ